MTLSRTLLYAAVLGAGLAFPATAATVHKWVDDNGVTHYSDQPPPPAAEDISQLSLNETTTSGPRKANGADNYYSIANQWQRMQLEQQQRIKNQIERDRLRQKNRTTETVRIVEESNRYIPVYRGYHKKRRHGHYPPIKHPPARPSRGSGLGAFPSIP